MPYANNQNSHQKLSGGPVILSSASSKKLWCHQRNIGTVGMTSFNVDIVFRSLCVTQNGVGPMTSVYVITRNTVGMFCQLHIQSVHSDCQGAHSKYISNYRPCFTVALISNMAVPHPLASDKITIQHGGELCPITISKQDVVFVRK